MAHEDLSFTTGDVTGTAVQAHTIHGNVYLQAPAPAEAPECDPPATWAETTGLPSGITRLLWAQEKAADRLPYQQLRGARTPSLDTVFVRQGLGGGVEETPADQTKPTLLPDEHGRLVEFPVVPSVRVTVRPPAKPMRAALDADPHLIIVGGPGQGKSTLTLGLTADICRNWKRKADDDTAPLKEPVIPLRITARTLAQHLGSSFTQALADSAFAEYGNYLNGPIDPALLAGRVTGCRWLLLVDALDEVADSALRATLVHTLQAWASLPNHRVLLTTRPTEGGVLASLQRAGAARYELQPFDRGALERFAHKWFEELGGDHADRFLRQIREAHLDELVEVPLLATIAAIVFEQHSERPLPSNQFELYVSYLEYVRGDRSAAGPFDRFRIPLIEHLGRTRLSTDGSLALAVHEWARLHDIAQVDALIAYLAGVGPFIQRGNDIAFLHHSFAEHVAATAMARDLPEFFAPEHRDFAELLHTARPEESGRFARSVLLHYTHLHAAEADRLLRWLHQGGADEHLLAARLLARHIPAAIPPVQEFLATARGWAMTTRYPALRILREVSRATRHPGLIEWLADLMATETAPWDSRAEAAVALAVRLRGAHTDDAVEFLRAGLDDRSLHVEDRLTAAEALAHSGSGEREVAERGLRSVLYDPHADGADCRSAAVVLAAFDGEARADAIAALERMVSDVDLPAEDLVEAATGLLEIDIEFHDLCAEVFLSILKDQTYSTEGRREATIGLASLGLRDAAAEALTATFHNRRLPTGYRSDAASMLAMLGPQHRTTAGNLLLDELSTAVVTKNDKVAYAPQLASLGHRDFAVAVLREVLTDPSTTWGHVRLAAVSLAELGPAFHEEAARYFEEVLAYTPAKGFDYTTALSQLSNLGEPHRSATIARMRAIVGDLAADPEARCTVASDLIRCAPEFRAEATNHLVSITRTERDRAVLNRAWRELSSLGPEFQGQAKQAVLALAEQDRDDGNVPSELGLMFRWFSAADQTTAANLLCEIARDENRGTRTRASAVNGLYWLGRKYHRQAAELVCDLIDADVPVNLYIAVAVFSSAGRGVRATVAQAVRGVLQNDYLRSAVAWSAVEALDMLGHRASDEVLCGIVHDESADASTRAECALMLVSRDAAHLSDATELVFRAAEFKWAPQWHPQVAQLAARGVDVQAQARAVLADPNTSCGRRISAASLLGAEGLNELRDLAEDPYLPIADRRRAHRMLAAVDSTSRAEAVAFCRDVVEDPDVDFEVRAFTAAVLAWLDRSLTPEVTSVLWKYAEAPLCSPYVRTSAARRLAGLDSPPSARLTQLLIGLVWHPELGKGWRHLLVQNLPRAWRTAAERADLMDRSGELTKRMPVRDEWGDVPLRAEAESVVRAVLADPASTARERRRAAVELAGLSPRLVGESVALLLADGTPAALADAARLGQWRLVRDMVLDEGRPARERRGIALQISALAETPAVRDMLTAETNLSWRDRVDVLAYVKRYDEVRALRDDPAGFPPQRLRAAKKLLRLTQADRSAAAELSRRIASDSAMRPILRQQATVCLLELGIRGRMEAKPLLRALVVDTRMTDQAKSWCANRFRNSIPGDEAEMVELQWRLATASAPLSRAGLLKSISWAPSREAVDELLRMADDRQLTSRVRIRCAEFAVEQRMVLKDRCAVVAREIAFDSTVPWHIRLRAAKRLGQWSDVMREDARALVIELRGGGA